MPVPFPFRTLLLVVCAAAGLACTSDESLAPTPEADESRVFTRVSLEPLNPVRYPGETFSLSVVARDQLGTPMRPDAITYSSSDPGVATVSESGIVTAVTGGTATISATVAIGASSRTGTIFVSVHEPPYAAVIEFGFGWGPPVVHVSAGAVVTWVASGISWSGVRTDVLWLMDENYGVLESLDLSGGAAARTFDTAGTYRYCSGACWDPPDFGVIHVN